eukprot:m.10937 g.10937  ORF g.10937 m.10937 type:complete len:307 (-) comp3117_c0_seq1:30-950(-)
MEWEEVEGDVPPDEPEVEEPLDDEYLSAQQQGRPPRLSFGAASAVGGCSSENEDRCLVVPDMREHGGLHDALFVVLDGHDGPEAAQYARDNLVYELRNSASYESHPGRALRDAVTEIDTKFLDWASDNGNNASGACIVAALVRGCHLSVAWAGDCRAVMYNAAADSSVALTVDHTARNPAEVDRLCAAATRVRNGRILGILEPSRTIGDADVKRKCPRGLISLCEMRDFVISPGAVGERGRSFVILASDGVFSPLSTGQAVDVVSAALDAHANLSDEERTQLASEALVRKAKQHTADDITAVVVLL